MNKITCVDDISELINNDEWMMQVLKAAEALNLPDWWIGAGFIRNKIWNYMENKNPEPSRDIDLVYYNESDKSAETDWDYDKKMAADFPFGEWEVRNQARMHYVNNFPPFTSTKDGISHWVETATCIAVRLTQGNLDYLFCYGTDDLFRLIARPTPYFVQEPLLSEFYGRVERKSWRQKWPNLKVLNS